LRAARSPRLLRQANDAEVADVRKVGDDDYEISAQRAPARGLMQLPAAREEAPTSPPAGDSGSETATTAEAAASGTRDNGQRFGVRFRRGSRGPLRAGEIPLIGVVQIEPPEEAVPASSVEPMQETKRARPKRPPRKRAAAAPTAGPPAEAAEAPPAKRPRTRSRKKAE